MAVAAAAAAAAGGPGTGTGGAADVTEEVQAAVCKTEPLGENGCASMGAIEGSGALGSPPAVMGGNGGLMEDLQMQLENAQWEQAQEQEQAQMQQQMQQHQQQQQQQQHQQQQPQQQQMQQHVQELTMQQHWQAGQAEAMQQSGYQYGQRQGQQQEQQQGQQQGQPREQQQDYQRQQIQHPLQQESPKLPLLLPQEEARSLREGSRKRKGMMLAVVSGSLRFHLCSFLQPNPCLLLSLPPSSPTIYGRCLPDAHFMKKSLKGA